MSDGNNSDDVTFLEVDERVRVRWKHVPTCTSKVLRPLCRRIGYLLNSVVELTQEACFCRFTAVAIPRTIFFELGERVLEKLEIHYRSARCR